MAARGRSSLCELCSRVHRDGDLPHCPRCHSDHLGLVRLYNRMIREHPGLRTKTILEAFSGLWEDWKRLKNAHAAPAADEARNRHR